MWNYVIMGYYVNGCEEVKMSRSLHSWIGSYLANRSMAVIIRNHCSRAFYLNSGVPQGSNLGSLIFLIFINDVTDSLSSEHYQLTI